MWRKRRRLLKRAGSVPDEMGPTKSRAMRGRGVQVKRPYKGRGDPVEPATVAKVEGSGRSWFRDKPTNRRNSSPGLI